MKWDTGEIASVVVSALLILGAVVFCYFSLSAYLRGNPKIIVTDDSADIKTLTCNFVETSKL